jgi:6-phosphofructokinase 1
MMKRIAVLTSGGDSPGMNAAIRAVVRTALYNGMETVGVMRGFEGLMDGEFTTLDRAAVGGIIHRGGTILRTARSERFKTEAGHRAALVQLENRKVDALVVIGGDGSFRGAADLGDLGLPVVGIPATIDNDVAGTDVAIGFDTATSSMAPARMPMMMMTISSSTRVNPARFFMSFFMVFPSCMFFLVLFAFMVIPPVL